MDDTKEAMLKMTEQIEKEQNVLESWEDRNNDDHGVMKR